jgi:hypothetical protein
VQEKNGDFFGLQGAGGRARWKFALDGGAAGIEVERRPMPAKWSWQLEAPVVLRAPARTIDWDPTNARPLPPDFIDGEEPATISLVPSGCTKFRISMFPATRRAWDEAGRSGP